MSNAMLANVLEYGKHGQPPKPFLKQTKVLEPETVYRGDAGGAKGGTGSPVSMLEELNMIVESTGLPMETVFSHLPRRMSTFVITPIRSILSCFRTMRLA